MQAWLALYRHNRQSITECRVKSRLKKLLQLFTALLDVQSKQDSAEINLTTGSKYSLVAFFGKTFPKNMRDASSGVGKSLDGVECIGALFSLQKLPNICFNQEMITKSGSCTFSSH